MELKMKQKNDGVGWYLHNTQRTIAKWKKKRKEKKKMQKVEILSLKHSFTESSQSFQLVHITEFSLKWH